LTPLQPIVTNLKSTRLRNLANTGPTFVAEPSPTAVVEALKANGLDVRPDDLMDLRKEHR
jgi:hypothetical protein